jgi:hypothetical protein
MPKFTARTAATAARMSKSRRKPFPLVRARKAAQVAREMGCDLLIGPAGEILLKTGGGAVVFEPPPIDGRSIPSNYPHRSDPSRRGGRRRARARRVSRISTRK